MLWVNIRKAWWLPSPLLLEHYGSYHHQGVEPEPIKERGCTTYTILLASHWYWWVPTTLITQPDSDYRSTLVDNVRIIYTRIKFSIFFAIVISARVIHSSDYFLSIVYNVLQEDNITNDVGTARHSRSQKLCIIPTTR